MPFALTFVGLLLIVTGFQNTYKQFGALVQGDFTGSGNFIYWLASIGIIGGLGYIKGLESFSRAFMFLILLVLFIGAYKKNSNIFGEVQGDIASGSTSTSPIGAPLGGGGGSSSSGSGGFNLSNIGQDASIVSSVAEFF